MLSVQENPLKVVNLSNYFIAQLAEGDQPGDQSEVTETAHERTAKIAHLRKVQSTNFVGRAVIRIADLFRRAS